MNKFTNKKQTQLTHTITLRHTAEELKMIEGLKLRAAEFAAAK